MGHIITDIGFPEQIDCQIGKDTLKHLDCIKHYRCRKQPAILIKGKLSVRLYEIAFEGTERLNPTFTRSTAEHATLKKPFFEMDPEFFLNIS